MADREDSIPEVPDLREIGVDIAEDLVDLFDPFANALASPLHGRLPFHRANETRMPLHLGVEVGQDRVEVAAVALAEGTALAPRPGWDWEEAQSSVTLPYIPCS